MSIQGDRKRRKRRKSRNSEINEAITGEWVSICRLSQDFLSSIYEDCISPFTILTFSFLATYFIIRN